MSVYYTSKGTESEARFKGNTKSSNLLSNKTNPKKRGLLLHIKADGKCSHCFYMAKSDFFHVRNFRGGRGQSKRQV